MFDIKLNQLKYNCIEKLKKASIKDMKELVSLASDIMALLYHSISRNRLRRDQILEDVKDQAKAKYQKLS
ncbi:hypothetical protein LCGC14_0789550 [marine sediment metagenome]|uniref:Uncharacterized protein n=1 Tax=marine sediment metagenome TaxID=412755 RepID=A0A0F9SCZ9_9ZZZZ